MASKPNGTARALAIVFPLAGALRANQVLRTRRPELSGAAPRFRDTEISHWQAALEGSPSLGAVIDQVYEEEGVRAAAVAGKAQRAFVAGVLAAGVLVLTVTRVSGVVSSWILIAALYAFAALFGAVRAVRLDGRLHVELDALADPLAAAIATRGEAACGVLLVAVRARRAAAVLHNRVVTQAAGNLADAAVASLRNAFVVLALWMLCDVAPAALTESVRAWHAARIALAAITTLAALHG